MANSSSPFCPNPGGTTTLAVSSTSASVALPSGAGSVAVTNLTGSAVCFVRFGASGLTASVPGNAGDYPILPGATQVLDAGNATYLAAITASGTATLYITAGAGA